MYYDDEILWFAMGAPYRNELKVEEMLKSHSIEVYLPRTRKVAVKNGHKSVCECPAVGNLLFVHSSLNRINTVKPLIPRLQFKTFRRQDMNVRIVVPDEQMQDFIRVTSEDVECRYLSPDEVDIAKGTRVRVIGGKLDGVEGVFMKVKGRRNRRLVILVEGAVAIETEVAPDLIELL